MKVGRIIILSFVLLSSIGCTKKAIVHNQLLQEGIAQVWTHTDSAQQVLDSIDIATLSDYELCRYQLAEAMLLLKRRTQFLEGIDMDALAEQLIDYNDAASAGEAYYIQGAYLNWLGENTRAMQYLKKAETHATSAIIRGMTYYKMGRISEVEQLYDIALSNYHKALPYLEEAGLPLYIASVYRELGRNTESLEKNKYFNQALEAARIHQDTILYLDIRYAQLSANQSNSPELAGICQFLCHKAGQKRYAYDLVKYYIRTHNADSARIYLDILAADTTAQIWSEQQYTLWESQYLHLKGRNREAYESLYTLYNEHFSKTESTSRASAFIAAQHYDNEVEHAKNLQLQLDKQRLHIILAIILITILSASIVLILYISRQRAQYLIEQTRSEQRIADLQQELHIRRNSLKRIMYQRIELSKNLQEAILSKKKEETVPQWAKEFIELNIFASEEQWQHFLGEFEDCYGDILTRLQKQYPRLTNTDIQVIALYILGMDNSDVCLLLGLTQRTVWSRRMRIKSRIGMGEKDSLDKWIGELV